MSGYCVAIEGLINGIMEGQENREEMALKMIKEYYTEGSNSPDRKRSSDLEKNTKAYLQSFKQ